MAEHLTVLLVESDPDLLEALELALADRGHRVLSAADGTTAADLLGRMLPDVAVFDMLLAGQSGLQLAMLLKERSDGRVPVVMMSGHVSAALRDYALAAGVDRFFDKPFPLADVVEAVEDLAVPAAVSTA